MKAPTLSVVIITHNEAAVIENCLRSVQWADEIIVVDFASTDDTVAICQRYTDKVTVTPNWPGFGQQKQRALAQATGDWVLSLDADEVLSDAAQQAIQQALQQSVYDGYRIRFQPYFLGKPIHHGDWRNEYHLRLFRRNTARFDDAPVHENLIFDGKSGQLQAPILHYSYQNVDQVLDKLQRYSSAGAQRRFAEGKSATPLKALLKSWWAFWRHYVIHMGFRDGWAGLILGLYIAHYTYYRYLKLWWQRQC